MSHQRHVPGIHALVGPEVVHNATQDPSPCANRAPITTRQDLANAMLHTPVEIRLDVAVVCRRQSVTAREDSFDRPAACSLSPAVFGSLLANLVPGPYLVQSNPGIGMHGLVPTEIQSEEDRRWAGRVRRQV